MMSAQTHRLKYILQLLGTIGILTLVPGNCLKTVLFLIFWMVTFFPIAKHECALFVGANVMFSVLDVMAVKQGIFYFNHPDFLGLPFWEFLMYGFYVLHGLRLLGGPVPQTNKLQVWALTLAFPLIIASIAPHSVLTFLTLFLIVQLVLFLHEKCDIFSLGFLVLGGNATKYVGIFVLALAFSLSFSCISDQTALTYVTFALLSLGIAFFHEKYDLLYLGYFILMGAVIEYAGIFCGIWGYPGKFLIGLPFWFITMWGCIGLLLRRLILPLLPERKELIHVR